MLKKLIGFIVLVTGLASGLYFTHACSAKVPDPPTKLDLVLANRLKEDLAQVRAIQAQANAATQAITQIANEALQPFSDDLDEICRVGKFSIDDVVKGTVRVNPKTGEITRTPAPPLETKPTTPPVKGTAK